MGKKKREHVVFDQMLKQKKTIPFSIVNKEVLKNGKENPWQEQWIMNDWDSIWW